MGRIPNAALIVEVKPMRLESAFGMDTSSIKYGPGVTREVGHDMSQWGVAGSWS